MRIAYILLAHKNPGQLARLVKALQYPNTTFFVHVDKTKDPAPFQAALSGCPGADIRYVKPEDGQWGRIGIVLGTLNALYAVAGENYSHAVLLSGMDYPLKSPAFIHDFLLQNQGTSFLQYFPIDERTPRDWLERFDRYHFALFGKAFTYPGASKSAQRRLLDAALSLYFPLPRKLPVFSRHYGGSQWWCLSREAVAYVLAFLAAHPEYVQAHRYTRLIDEIFFQTILVNAPDGAATGNIVNDNLKYIDWSRPKPRPATFTHVDFELLVNSGKLFARKFDEQKDARILDMLDQQRMQEAGQAIG